MKFYILDDKNSLVWFTEYWGIDLFSEKLASLEKTNADIDSSDIWMNWSSLP